MATDIRSRCRDALPSDWCRVRMRVRRGRGGVGGRVGVLALHQEVVAADSACEGREGEEGDFDGKLHLGRFSQKRKKDWI